MAYVGVSVWSSYLPCNPRSLELVVNLSVAKDDVSCDSSHCKEPLSKNVQTSGISYSGKDTIIYILYDAEPLCQSKRIMFLLADSQYRYTQNLSYKWSTEALASALIEFWMRLET